ncbi:MAG TPA: 23S rRNA (adenine(2503)-C(2))-methyltransferase RlmN [Armatimonadota bacterium]|jgi:23S rRNA (adenine2503-C2)-methyltransferase
MSDYSTMERNGKPVEIIRPALLGRTREELREAAAGLRQPAYRGNQLAAWLYERRASAFEDMSDLPKGMRESLGHRYSVGRPAVAAAQEAPDHTTKFLLRLADGVAVEAVLLPYADRATVCVSSQVGCAAGCSFCATATMGFTRNLTAGEIVGQALAAADVLAAARWAGPVEGRRVDHVVFMGMGEPLWNLDNVLKAVRLLNEEVGIGMRGITISTVGIPDEMRRLADERLQLTLAVSLHAGTDDTRKALVPVARKHSFDAVLDAARYYFNRTGRRVTFEYVMLGGDNDTEEEALALARRLRGTPSHVNLIPWNPALSRVEHFAPDPRSLRGFRGVLEAAGIAVTQRQERGQGIAAACGQLAVKEEAFAEW